LFYGQEHSKTIVINCGFEFLIPQHILNKISFINIHPSFLPYNRGCHHSFWSIMEKTPKGATIHWINKDYDAAL